MDTVIITVKYYIIFPNGSETRETEKWLCINIAIMMM